MTRRLLALTMALTPLLVLPSSAQAAPFFTGAHVPVATPVRAASQAEAGSEHAVLQQKPSTQCALTQSMSVAHGVPSAACRQISTEARSPPDTMTAPASTPSSKASVVAPTRESASG